MFLGFFNFFSHFLANDLYTLSFVKGSFFLQQCSFFKSPESLRMHSFFSTIFSTENFLQSQLENKRDGKFKTWFNAELNVMRFTTTTV